MFEILTAAKLPLLATTDILVIGAESAGCIAALTASNGKYSAMLVERYGFPGGTSPGCRYFQKRLEEQCEKYLI